MSIIFILTIAALFFMYDNNFAVAWVMAPSTSCSSCLRRRRRRSSRRHHHHRSLVMPPMSSSLLDNQFRSRSYQRVPLRWYHFHDDDGEAAKETVDIGAVVDEALLSPPKSNNWNNNIIGDGGEEKRNNESPFHYNDETTKLDLRILLIDNHDSYTYNLYQYISTMTIHPVHVIMNDAYSCYDDFIVTLGSSNSHTTTTSAHTIHNNSVISACNNDTTILLDQYFDCIILSPGPGTPSRPADMGIVLDVIRQNAKLPILGVCLGHQALGYVYGQEVKLSPSGPVHGLMSSVVFKESESRKPGYDEDDGAVRKEGTHARENNIPICQLFRGLPQQFNVVRYHSLVVDFTTTRNDDDDDGDSSEIEPIAWCDGINESNVDSNHPDSNHVICMALRHKRYPHYGVQFHPESIGTGVAGYTLLWNFCEFAHQWKSSKENESHIMTNDEVAVEMHNKKIREVSLKNTHEVMKEKDVPTTASSDAPTTHSKYRVFIHKIVPDTSITSLPLPKQVFEELYSSRATSFWLDSSTGEAHYNDNMNNFNDDENEGCPIASNSRFSIMGSDDGPLSRNIQYFGREHDRQRRGLRILSAPGVTGDTTLNEDILSYLRRRLVEEREIVNRVDVVTFDESKSSTGDLGYKLRQMNEFAEGIDNQLPFDYRGGYVGYLGYEVRHDTQCWILEQEGAGCPVSGFDDSSDVIANPNIPTASFLFADRSLLYDHQTKDWYIIGIAEIDVRISADGSSSPTSLAEGDVITWMQDMKSKIEAIGRNEEKAKPTPKLGFANDVVFFPNRSKTQYLSDISRSHEEIRNGESYELCVTNQLQAEIQLRKQPGKALHESPYELYRILREKNPAPFSAFMNFYNEGSLESTASVSICCSSPERFLYVRRAHQKSSILNTPNHVPKKRFVVESKPIKGTAARYTGSGNELESEEQVIQTDTEIAAKLSRSVKDRAENLMIVDLLRNDLGRVCMVGSVHVPKLMHIESYATVHQMVSTVRGTLDGDTSHAIDVIEACFPGGSMTGAPKQRTMEILDEIEQGANRGPYSGCLGYISLNGSMDMNIIIRTAVLTPGDNTNVEDMESWKASVGCGGAITALSNSDNEYNEMLIKSEVVTRSISEWVARVNEDRSQNRRHSDDEHEENANES